MEQRAIQAFLDAIGYPACAKDNDFKIIAYNKAYETAFFNPASNGNRIEERMFASNTFSEIRRKDLLVQIPANDSFHSSELVVESFEGYKEDYVIKVSCNRLLGKDRLIINVFEPRKKIIALENSVIKLERENEVLKGMIANGGMAGDYQKAIYASTLLVKYDTEWRVRYVNEPFLAATGLKKDDFYLKHAEQICSGESDRLPDDWDGKPVSKIVKIKGKEKDVWTKTTIVMVGSKETFTAEILAIKNDITETKEAEAKLEVALRSLERAMVERDVVVTAATHAIKTPIASISGISSMIADEDFGTLPERVKEQVQKLNASSDGVLEIVEGIESFSSFTKENKPKEQVSLSMIETELKRLIKRIKRTGKEMKYSLSGGDANVSWEHASLAFRSMAFAVASISHAIFTVDINVSKTGIIAQFKTKMHADQKRLKSLFSSPESYSERGILFLAVKKAAESGKIKISVGAEGDSVVFSLIA